MLYVDEKYLCKNILVSGLLCWSEGTFSKREVSFFSEEERYCTTVMHFPAKNVEDEIKQAQNLNYDYFVQTMADMIKKYAKEILD